LGVLKIVPKVGGDEEEGVTGREGEKRGNERAEKKPFRRRREGGGRKLSEKLHMSYVN